MTVIFSPSTTEKEINVRANLFMEDLLDIPVQSISDVFAKARKECSTFPKPLQLLNFWNEIKFDSVPKPKSVIKYNEYDMASKDEHRACMVVNQLVLDGKCGVNEGKAYVNGIFDGSLPVDEVIKRSKLKI